MQQYLDLLRDVRDNGVRKPTRAVLQSTGEHVDALSVFGRMLRFDLTKGFPLVTTKRVNFDAIVHELLWFLSGSTNVAYLEDNGVNIWSAWKDADGDLGPLYPKQWRAWESPTGEQTDQIAAIVRGIRHVIASPTASAGRRLILSSWNVADLPRMALAPCHYTSQFMVTDGRLSGLVNIRSNDLALGAPYNIASYALLTHLLAHVTGLQVGELVYSIGDAHVYVNHLDLVERQLARTPLPLPRLVLDQAIKDLDHLTREQISLVDYTSHPALYGEVAV